MLAPGDHGYDGARLVFNRRFDAIRPPAVVRVRDTADVQADGALGGRHDVPLVVRSGGNAYNGASTSGAAVVVDVGRLDGFGLDGDDRHRRPGLRNIELYAAARAARAHGPVRARARPWRSAGSRTGGGMGLAGRALGLTLDRVAALDVVTADGERLRGRARDERPLLGAARRRRQLRDRHRRAPARAPAAPRRVVLRLVSGERARGGARRLGRPRARRAGRLTSICTLTGSARDRVRPVPRAREPPLRRLVAPLARMAARASAPARASFLALQRRWAGCADGGLAACRGAAREFDASSVYVARRLSAAGRARSSPRADAGATLVLDAYGGAINRVPPDATAFVHRDVRFSVQILSYARSAPPAGACAAPGR